MATVAAVGLEDVPGIGVASTSPRVSVRSYQKRARALDLQKLEGAPLLRSSVHDLRLLGVLCVDDFPSTL